VALTDHAMEQVFTLEGNKADFCAYLDKALPAMSKALTGVQVTRDDFTIKRDPWHWWTADVSYTEHRTTSLAGGVELKTLGQDHLVLVKTLTGVRVKRLEAETWKDDGA
jgi:hypothetical protein